MNPNARSSGRDGKRKRESVSFETLVNPNFEELARQFPAFQAAYREVSARKGKKFEATPEFSLALSRALLQVHWNLQLPHFDSRHHLCPPIPNRYFFVRWLQSVVLPFSSGGARAFEQAASSGAPPAPSLPLRGLDVGTGAAAIYALLFAASDPAATVLATDVDPHSVDQATANVRANRLESRVTVRLVRPTYSQQKCHHQQQPTTGGAVVESTTTAQMADEREDDLLRSALPKGPLRCSLDALPDDDNANQTRRLDFCMTNPPFFDSTEGGPGPRSDGRDRVAMTHEEGSYPGGELAFVVDIIADGLFLWWKQRHISSSSGGLPHPWCGGAPPRWTSCMCGKKSTFTKLRGILHYLLGPSHVLSTEFGPGFLTRWFLAWTFDRPAMDSPLAPSKSWTFDTLAIVEPTTPQPLCPIPSSEQSVLDEIEQRLREYCASFPAPRLVLVNGGGSLPGRRLLRVVPATPEVCTDRDATLPDPLRRLLTEVPVARRLEWLPLQGQFGIDVSVSTLPSPGVARVALTSYAHSKASVAVLDKIQLQLEGEISRTNRKWRRILQRQQSHAPSNRAASAMDVTD